MQRQAWRERKKSREEIRRRTAEEELRRCEEREKLADRERQLEEAQKVIFKKLNERSVYFPKLCAVKCINTGI